MTLLTGLNIGALAEEQAARQQAESTATAAVAATASAEPANRQLPLIRKPHGSAGDGYRLIEEMGLADDKLTYNAIVVSIVPDFLRFY